MISRLNWVDILVVIIVLRISYVAFQDGLSHQIFPLIGTTVTAVIALHYYHDIARLIYDNAVKLPMKFLDFLAFVSLIIAVGLLFKFLRGFSEKIIKVTWHPLVEKGGGLVFGFLRSAVVVSVILMILALMPFSYLQHSIRDRSATGMDFLRIVPNIHAKVSRLLPTFKVETKGADREEVVQDLVADKSIASKSESSKENIRKEKTPNK